MASKSTKRRVRRSEGFRVRRWLQLGAASAGVSAALLGLSSLGPDVSVAAADTGGPSSSASESSASDDSGRASKSGRVRSRDAGKSHDAGSSDARDSDAQDDDSGGNGSRGNDASADDDASDDVDADDDDASDDVDDDAADAADVDDDGPEPESLTETVAAPAADEPQADDPPAVAVAEPAKPWAVRARSPQNEHREAVAAQIAAFTASSQQFIASLPVGEPVKDLLNGGLFLVRRTFLNQAPVVTPITFTANSGGPISGRVGAVDPEGDWIVYRVVQGPESGRVQINPDGTYTYTPGADFDGVETFAVAAYDVGLHVNLVDLFRPLGTRADMLVNQGAVKFSFNYTTGAEHWTPARQAALQRAADALMSHFMVTTPVTLTYDVAAEEKWDSPVLASAYSQLIDSTTAGFFPGIIQHKLQTGLDANGDTADGNITWNFGRNWALGDTVAPTELDFRSTALHELMHSFGIEGGVNEAGQNTDPNRSTFDSWITNADGTKVIRPDFQWDSTFDPNLTGGNGGLYFGGPSVVAAYGKPVPLFTPNPFEPGSSAAHLDDKTFTGLNRKLMNAYALRGPGIRVISPIELAIMADLGYITIPSAAAPVATVPWALQASSPVSEGQREVAAQIAAFTASSRAWIASLPVSAPAKEALTGTLFTLRGVLLNQAPVVASVVQVTGAAGEPVHGRVGAVDPDGDRIVYRLVQGPKSGSVQVNSDGTYLYTPGADSDGVATFAVAAYDVGLHVNLVDLFRPLGTRTDMLVNQGAIKFDFDYTEGAQYWTPERRAALRDSSSALALHFLVTKPVTLHYEVVGYNDPGVNILASMESKGISEDPGLQPTVVQHKLLTGLDANGAAADGDIKWNFAEPWGLGDDVPAGAFDFRATASHELMHSFGFSSNVEAPGTDVGRSRLVIDGFLATADGVRVLNGDYSWNPVYDPNLTGGNGGLYFAGPNAMAVYGGPVPLFAPRVWDEGSSLSHLDDLTFIAPNEKLMNAATGSGLGIRVLSPIEVAIMKDLGYIVVAPQVFA